MAKCSKLTKLKSTVMKKWISFGRNSSSSISSESLSHNDTKCTNEKHFPVYVGKSLRPYLVDTKTASNPIFRELVERSSSSSLSLSSSGLCSESTVIACEVVLFEHLLWMLNNCKNGFDDGNNDNGEHWQVSELVEFYAC